MDGYGLDGLWACQKACQCSTNACAHETRRVACLEQTATIHIPEVLEWLMEDIMDDLNAVLKHPLQPKQGFTIEVAPNQPSRLSRTGTAGTAGMGISIKFYLILEEAARTAARRDWSRMGLPGEQVAYALIVASYRRRMHGRHRSTGDGAAPIPPVAVRGPHPPPA